MQQAPQPLWAHPVRDVIVTRRTESGAHLQMRSGSGRLARRQALDDVVQAR